MQYKTECAKEQLQKDIEQLNRAYTAGTEKITTVQKELSTVIGMIRSFAALSAGGGTDSMALSQGISEDNVFCVGISNLGKLFKFAIPKNNTWLQFSTQDKTAYTFADGEQINVICLYKIK